MVEKEVTKIICWKDIFLSYFSDFFQYKILQKVSPEIIAYLLADPGAVLSISSVSLAELRPKNYWLLLEIEPLNPLV